MGNKLQFGVGNLIAYWNTGVTREECVKIVKDALKSAGWRGCVAKAYSDDFDRVSTLGLPPTRVKITLPSPSGAYRLPERGGTVSNLSAVKVAFTADRGYFDIEDHREFNVWLSKQTVRSEADVARITEGRRFDGTVFTCRVFTDAKVRPYRRREWHPYEPAGHFMYDSSLKGLAEQLALSLGGVFADMPDKAKRKAGLL